MSFLDDWVNRPKDPEKLSRFTVQHNRWDRQTVQRLLKEVREFNAKRQKLIDVVAGDVGYDVWQDFWLSFWKVSPEMEPESNVRPSHIINHMVLREAQDLAEHGELRQWTNGDDVGSCLACITMEPDLETLYDRMHEAQKLADELDELLSQLAQATQSQQSAEDVWNEWTQENDPEAPENQEANAEHQQQQQSLQEQIDALKKQMAEQGQQLEDMLSEARPDIRQSLREMIGKANDEAEAVQMGGQTCGMEPSQLHRLSAKERIDLAKKLNTPHFHQVAKLFGRIKSFAMRQQRQKVQYLREETFDIEIGDDIDRVLPVKLAQLADEDEEYLFYADYLEKKLPQYKMRGHERLGKGGIIEVHDGSGSMSGQKEMWAKAVGLVLLHIAKKQKRPFYGIQFSFAPTVRIDDFRDTSKITPDKVLDFAEFFFGGGTDFMYPLDRAMEIIEEEYKRTGRTHSDIIFVTDGQASVNAPWFETFKKKQEEFAFQVWGVLVGGGAVTTEPLHSICDGRVCTIKDLTSGEDIGKIFSSI